MQPAANSPSRPASRRLILVCQQRSCLRNGSAAVLSALQAESSHHCLVAGSDCTGQCSSGPTVRVMPDQIWYCRVQVEDVSSIMEQHIRHNQPVQRLLHPRFHPSYSP